jgi:hypothetical protein
MMQSPSFYSWSTAQNVIKPTRLSKAYVSSAAFPQAVCGRAAWDNSKSRERLVAAILHPFWRLGLSMLTTISGL